MKDVFKKKYLTSPELRDAGFKAVGHNVHIHPDCNIHGLQNISLGHNVRIDAYVSIIASGPVDIGSYIHIGSYSLLSGGEGIRMADFSGLSQSVKIYTRSDDYSGEYLTNPCVPEEFTHVQRGAVILEKHVIVGSGSVVLPGVTIGEGSSVGALSLVNKNLPNWGIYFGAPAKRIGGRSQKLLELEQKLMSRSAA